MTNRNIEQIIKEVKKSILLDAHPVGSFYISEEVIDPSELFGGLWEKLPEGYVLRTTSQRSELGTPDGQNTIRSYNLPKTYVKAEGAEGYSDRVGGSYNNTETTYTVVSMTADASSANIKTGKSSNNSLFIGESSPRPFIPSHIKVFMWRRIG